ncbi:MAG: OmpA family protein [Rhodovarius sp.]|nr:OmpA family protein [Rhodovarius sp.]
MRAAPGLALLLLAAAAGAAPPAAAQVRPFSCVGVEALEDAQVAVPFPHGSDRPDAAGESALATALAWALESPRRNICVLGHALASEGGAQTGQRLAAARARAVAARLAAGGVDPARIRAEARVAGFTRSEAARPARGATVILLPEEAP